MSRLFDAIMAALTLFILTGAGALLWAGAVYLWRQT